jgi:hypothetical protein
MEEFTLHLTKILSEQKAQIEVKTKAQTFAKDHDFRVLARQLEGILVGEAAKLTN